MASKKMAQALRSALYLTIKNNINAELDTVWTANASDDTTYGTVPKAYPQAYVWRSQHRRLIAEYPAIVISSQSGHIVNNGATNWAEVDHHLDIAVVLMADDADIMGEQLERYLVAIWEVLMKNQFLDNSITGLAGIDPREYSVDPIYKLEKSTQAMQSAGWQIIAHVVEAVN